MKSKRSLKKQIRYICGDLVGECLLIGEICPEEKQDEVARLVVDLAVLQEQTLGHCSFSFDKSVRDFGSVSEYKQAKSQYVRKAYAALHDQFNARLSELVHRMNQIAGLAKGE
ncbi:MAG: hypothetical protein K2O38_04795 [Muribaculaceae bacterium]|nr:hypothetical protein [Muribaculaceae bacterium]